MSGSARDNLNLSQNPVHASCVSVEGNGLLIFGPSGSGKSSLALEMMALGADLLSDDRCQLSVFNERLYASPPDTIAGRIEARGIGILKASNVQQSRVAAAIDLGKTELQRLPEPRTIWIMGVEIPSYHKPENAPVAAMMMQLLKAGRYA